MMKITFISNYLTHHQIPFSEKMAELPGIEYYFISTLPMEEERVAMGWSCREIYPYEIKAYQSAELQQKAERLAEESDVVIIGSAPDSYIASRLKQKRLTFRYAERFYKQGLNIKNIGRAFAGSLLHHRKYRKSPLYMLCASAYTAVDGAVFGNYIGKTFRWGYFPQLEEYDIDTLMDQKVGNLTKRVNQQITILWAGRLLPWKHPDAMLDIAEQLKKSGYDFEMQIIGIGEMQEKLEQIMVEKNLSDCVSLLGAIKPEYVRKYMEQADIFVFTSDFNEGWGAVLNEAMNSGCAVVASHAIGSVPFLIEDKKNGLIYQNGNQEALESKVMWLLDHPNERRKLGENAYLTIRDLWNAQIAASRFVKLSEMLLKGENVEMLFKEGPCSRAKILKNDWYIDKE